MKKKVEFKIIFQDKETQQRLNKWIDKLAD